MPVTVSTRLRQTGMFTLPESRGLIVSARRTASRSLAASVISLPKVMNRVVRAGVHQP